MTGLNVNLMHCVRYTDGNGQETEILRLGFTQDCRSCILDLNGMPHQMTRAQFQSIGAAFYEVAEQVCPDVPKSRLV